MSEISEQKSGVEEYRELKLNGKNGGVALVSNEDFEELSKYKWYVHKKGYIHGDVNRKKLKMHHFILKPKEGMIVDHINGIKYDNRRTNLRYLPENKNAQNKHLNKENRSSKYRGVSYNKNDNKYWVQIRIDNVRHHLGRYDTETIAAEVWDMYVVNNGLDHIELNFPDKRDEYLSRTYEPFKSKGSPSSTGYIGVSKKDGKYNVGVHHDGHRRYIGDYKDLIEAANKYDEYIVKHDILEKQLNFPDKYPEYLNKRIIRTKCEPVDDTTVKLLIDGYDDSLKPVLIDKEDYDKVKHHKCSIVSGYVHIDTKEKSLILSRFLSEVNDTSIYIDHIDSNPMNNTRKNLRLSNFIKNAQNKEKMDGATSKYYGVSYHKNTDRWVAYVANDNEVKFRKTYADEQTAARARDLYILDNIPEPHYKFNFEWTEEDKISWRKKLNDIYDEYDNRFTSMYTGIHHNDKYDTWIVSIKKNQKKVHSKSFTDEETAARYRDLWLLGNLNDDVKKGKYKLNFDWTETDISKWKLTLELK
jgi:hypothetical protein